MSIEALSNLYTPQTEQTRTGRIISTDKGEGTFSQTKTANEDGSVSKHQEVTFGDKTKTSDTTIVENEDGSRTITSSSVGPDGKTRSKVTTLTPNEDGSFTVSATITRADGEVITASGVKTKTADGRSTSLTLTDDEGNTGTLDRKVVKGDEGTSYTTTGTRANGKQHSESHIVIVDA